MGRVASPAPARCRPGVPRAGGSLCTVHSVLPRGSPGTAGPPPAHLPVATLHCSQISTARAAVPTGGATVLGSKHGSSRGQGCARERSHRGTGVLARGQCGARQGAGCRPRRARSRETRGPGGARSRGGARRRGLRDAPCRTGSRRRRWRPDGARPPLSCVCHVSMVFVRPQWWRRGVGTALVLALRQRARKLGYVRLQVWTGEGNERARALYRRAGFAPSGQRKVIAGAGRPVHLVMIIGNLTE